MPVPPSCGDSSLGLGVHPQRRRHNNSRQPRRHQNPPQPPATHQGRMTSSPLVLNCKDEICGSPCRHDSLPTAHPPTHAPTCANLLRCFNHAQLDESYRARIGGCTFRGQPGSSSEPALTAATSGEFRAGSSDGLFSQYRASPLACEFVAAQWTRGDLTTRNSVPKSGPSRRSARRPKPSSPVLGAVHSNSRSAPFVLRADRRPSCM
jgi:hypothetical protein